MTCTRHLWVLNGPNLNRLGTREPDVYGADTLADIERRVRQRAGDAVVTFRQSNHEGVLLDWIHEACGQADALILNAGALTHTSVALHDALRCFAGVIIETHLSNPHARETFRHTSTISSVARGIIQGFGPLSYELAVDAALALLQSQRPVSAQ